MCGTRAAVNTCGTRGKNRAVEESPFLQALMALKAGLQASPAACEGFHKALLALSGRVLPICTALHVACMRHPQAWLRSPRTITLPAKRTPALCQSGRLLAAGRAVQRTTAQQPWMLSC